MITILFIFFIVFLIIFSIIISFIETIFLYLMNNKYYKTFLLNLLIFVFFIYTNLIIFIIGIFLDAYPFYYILLLIPIAIIIKYIILFFFYNYKSKIYMKISFRFDTILLQITILTFLEIIVIFLILYIGFPIIL